MSDVQCTGDEKDIVSCNFKSYSLEEGRLKLTSVNIAGVKCGGVTSLSSLIPRHSCSFLNTADKSKAAPQDPASIVLGVLVGIFLIAVFILLATSIMLR